MKQKEWTKHEQTPVNDNRKSWKNNGEMEKWTNHENTMNKNQNHEKMNTSWTAHGNMKKNLNNSWNNNETNGKKKRKWTHHENTM